MKIEIGNPWTIEGYRDPRSDDPEKVRYRSLPGERVSTFYVPEGMPRQEAIETVLATIPIHLDTSHGGIPAWVESDDAEARKVICNHYGLNVKRRRPPTWGDGSHGPYPTDANPNPSQPKSSKKE